MPTQQQLDNRLNPTPVNINIPGEGQVFRSNDNAGSAYYYSGGKLYSINLSSIGKQAYGDNIDALGGAYNYQNGTWDAGIKALKDNYGIDYNSIGVAGYNLADLSSSYAGAGDVNTLKSLLGKTSGASTTQTLNGPGTVDPNSVVPNVPGQTTQPTNTASNPITGTFAPGTAQNAGATAQQQTTTGTAGGAPITAAQNQAPQQAQPMAQTTPQNAQNGAVAGSVAPGGYMGPSIVDYLNSLGKPSDFSTRANLAKQNGIANYTGTAAQNTQLLNTLRSTNAPTITNPNANASGLTVGTGAGAASQPSMGVDKYANLDPISRQVQMYTDAATALGLPTIKQQYEKVVKDQADLTDKMNEQIANVRNNPWLSQGIADKEVQKIQDKNKTQLDTLTHLETLYDSMYKTGQAQVEHIVSGAAADVKAANDLAQKQLDAASALAKDNQVVTIGNNEVLVNKATGKQVAVLGPTAKAVNPATDSIAKQNQSQADDVASAVLDFENRMKTLNQKGANPDAYAYYKAQLTKNYGASAALALDAAMKAADITVDYGK